MGEVTMRRRVMNRRVAGVTASSGVVLALVLSPGLAMAQAPAVQQATNGDIQAAVNAAYDKFKNLKEGKNADYIPVLAKVDPKIFGIVVITPDGKVYAAGDT